MFSRMELLAAVFLVCLAAKTGYSNSSPDSNFSAPVRSASAAFWRHWGDGKAELSGYRVTTQRYGQKREAEVVFIYVTESLDTKTLIKNESAPPARKLPVLKLNRMLRFKTGIYPYSVMTSVFSPVGVYRGRRFNPVKIALSSQEWCGHVFHQLKLDNETARESLRSYFSNEGEHDRNLTLGSSLLYADSLPIQLRELDGVFNGGRNWSGKIVPELWEMRKAHTTLQGLDGRIVRKHAQRGSAPITRFVVSYGGYSVEYDVEKAFPRRILAWRTSNGESAILLRTARLSYWQLNHVGEETYRRKLGLTP